MLNCPHCKRATISAWDKYWAGTADPVECTYCKKPSSVSKHIETASMLLYVVAGLFALSLFAVDVIAVRNHGPGADRLGAYPFIGLLVFYVAVEAAKVLWVPLEALSDVEVKKRVSSYNRIFTVGWIVMICGWLLSKCGF